MSAELHPPPAPLVGPLLALHRAALGASEPELYAAAIEAAVAATASGIGYFHLVNEDQETIELGTWSRGTLRQCNAVYQRHYPISAAGVWADSARHRVPVLHNDYQALADRSGYPEGHVHLVRHLGVPVVDDGLVVLLVGVGNKEAPYEDRDLEALQAIADEAWRLIARSREVTRLAAAERLLRELQDEAAIGLWEWDAAEGRFTGDERLRRLFGAVAEPPPEAGLDALLRYVDPRHHASLREVFREPTEGVEFAMEADGTRLDGTPLTLHLRGTAHPRSQGHGVVLRGIVQDITERRELTRARHLARHDGLTGLANRQALLEELIARLTPTRREGDAAFAVHYIDLDRFKPINDTHGHGVGDRVLQVVAERLQRATRQGDFVARLGGDELVVVQPRVPREGAALALAAKIIATLEEPMRLGGLTLQVGASVGIALAAADAAEGAEELLARADRAMYLAKLAGRGRFQLAEPPAPARGVTGR